jgi:hypothetical protein
LEPKATGGAQNQGFYALQTADTQLEFDTGDAAYVADGNLIATRPVAPQGCKVICIKSICYVRCGS